MIESIWVFHGGGSSFTSGVFTTRAKAEEFISKHNLEGILTKYPLDVIIYDWAIENGFFKVKKPHQTSPEFIQRFTTACQEHYHYEAVRSASHTAD